MEKLQTIHIRGLYDAGLSGVVDPDYPMPDYLELLIRIIRIILYLLSYPFIIASIA